MLKLTLSAMLVLLLASGALAADQFEGRWTVTVTPDDDAQSAGEEEFDETLVFKGLKFVAEQWNEKRGFDEVEYEADTRGLTAATFTAEQESETEGTAKWTGMTTGQQIKGELTWTKKDGTVLRYTFEGTREE